MIVVPDPPESCGVFFRFYLRNIFVFAPVTLLSVDNIGGLRPLQHASFLCATPPTGLCLQISAIFHFFA